MIDLKECIIFCIENFDSEEATERLFNFINESIELKEREIELRNAINIPDILKEPTIDYLKKTIKAIYGCDYNVCSNRYTVHVDPCFMSKEEKKLIDRFQERNNLFEFVFNTRHVSSNCNSF